MLPWLLLHVMHNFQDLIPGSARSERSVDFGGSESLKQVVVLKPDEVDEYVEMSARKQSSIGGNSSHHSGDLRDPPVAYRGGAVGQQMQHRHGDFPGTASDAAAARLAAPVDPPAQTDSAATLSSSSNVPDHTENAGAVRLPLLSLGGAPQTAVPEANSSTWPIREPASGHADAAAENISHTKPAMAAIDLGGIKRNLGESVHDGATAAVVGDDDELSNARAADSPTESPRLQQHREDIIAAYF